MKRVKKISKDQFREIQARKWQPVSLVGAAIPDFLKNIPKERVYSIVASGTYLPEISYSDNTIPSGNLIGGSMFTGMLQRTQ